MKSVSDELFIIACYLLASNEAVDMMSPASEAMMAITRKGSTINDIFTASMEAEAFDGVGGYDIVTYAPSRSAVRIDFTNFANNTGDATGDTYANIDSFRLTIYNDVFIGAQTMDVVNGDAGNDVLEGRGGNDSLTGHSGHDTVLGGEGNDSIWGGGGNDVLQGDAGNDQIWGDADSDVISGGADLGTLAAELVEQLVDGSFESSPVAAGSWTNTATVGGWKSDTRIETWGENFGGVTATEGVKLAELDYDLRVSNIYQDVKTDAGIEYAFRFDYMKRPGSPVGSDTILVFWNGTQVGVADPTVSVWAQASFKVVGTGGMDRIEFREVIRDNDSFGGLIDNASLKSTGRITGVAASTETKVKDVTFGDQITGGSHADTFVFNLGDGVDRINDFVKGTDRLDIAADLFDGNSANGEFTAVDHAGGALILFRDSSADGFVDNNGILLAGLRASAIDATIFI